MQRGLIRFGLMAFASGCLLGGAPAFAMAEASAAAEQEYIFEDRETDLAALLAYFSKLTGVQSFYKDARLSRMPVRFRGGHMSLAEALSQILASTGYDYRFSGADTVIIQRRPLPHQAALGELSALDDSASGQGIVQEIYVSAPRTTALGFRKISPTTVLDGIYLTQVGQTNLARALYGTPAVTASRSAENTVYTGFGPGVNMLDLRDLGVVRSLVVVNGRRHVPTNGGSADFVAVDVNTLPVGLIDRVEILTTGSSVLYGADALGGLVNVVLREDFEGLSLSANGNLSERGDNGRYTLSASFGDRFLGERGHYMAFVNLQRSDGLKARDRFISSDPAGFALNGVPRSPYDGGLLTRGFGRAPASESGTAVGYALGNGSFRNFDGETWIAVGADGLPAGDYVGLPSQRYNWAQHSDLTTPIDTLVYSGTARLEVGENTDLFFEHTFARSLVDRELAPPPIYVIGQQGVFIPIENPFIPEDIRAEIRSEVGDDVSGIFLNRRLVEVGNRTDTIRRDLIRLAAGIEGQLGQGWDYSLSYQYGLSASRVHGLNAADVDRIEISASPTLCAAHAGEGCVLTNYFGLNSVSAAQADYLRTSYLSRAHNSQHIVEAELKGSPFSLPHGPLSLIWGAQYRHEYSDVAPDDKIRRGRIAGMSFLEASAGSFDVAETYLAASAPLLANLPLVEELTLDAGFRVSHFSTVGSLFSWQAGLDYRPVSTLRLRASYQEANRAPNLSELYLPGTSQRSYYYDPCNDADGQDPDIAANCAAAGALGAVPVDFYQRSVYADGQFSGNAHLSEERAHTRNLGLTFSPTLPHGWGSLYLSLDWFDIKIRNFVRSRSLQFILNECYESFDLSSFYCGPNPANGRPFFTRSADTHEIETVNLSLQNGGTFTARGIDTELVYTLDLAAHGLMDDGRLKFRLLHSYNLRSDLKSDFGEPEEIFRGSISRPLHKIVTSLSFETGRWFVDWTVNFRSKGIVNPFEDAEVDGNLASGTAYHAIALNVQLQDGLSLQAGVENLFDHQPPFLAYADHNTFPEYYDVVGRRFFLGFQSRF